MKNLIIVESPSKARTIKKILNNEYEILSSQGHICDLPKKTLGIDINNDFKPEYIVDKTKKKIITELKNKSKDAEFIYLASDDDREGEAISWHLKNTLELDDKRTKRIVFHEITEKAITNAIQNPREIDINTVNSQQTRRILDRLVGYKISPILWTRIKSGLSAGRVQSVAVKLIVEKEREIENFKPTTYFKVTSIFKYNSKEFKAELKNNLKSKEEVINLFETLKDATFYVTDIEKKTVFKEPVAPFTTSTLQQEANTKLGLSVSTTMQLAQKLYENGKITYMRTDSVLLSDFAISQAREFILKEYGEEYLQNRQFKTKSKLVQGAHEAIRPTDISQPNASNDEYEQKLYTLIRNRCLASQMANTKINKTTLTIKPDTNNTVEFISQGEIIEFDGFLRTYKVQSEKEEENIILPKDISKNTIVKLIQAKGEEKNTNHPARFTEATLVKELEEKGIGRPSTYAQIISVIQTRGYIIKSSKVGVKKDITIITLTDNKISENTESKTKNSEKNKLYPTDIGIIVNDFLVKQFNDITDYDFTATIEKELDNISEGKLDWILFLHKFYDNFSKELDNCTENKNKIEFKPKLIGVDPKTNQNMYLKVTKYGAVLQIGENDKINKPKYYSLLKNQNINNLTYEDALQLTTLPKTLGQYNGSDVTIHNGMYGPYIKNGNTNTKIFDLSRVFEMTIDEAIEIIKNRDKYSNNHTKS